MLRFKWTLKWPLLPLLLLASLNTGCEEDPLQPTANASPSASALAPPVNAQAPAKPTDVQSLLNLLTGNGSKTWQVTKRTEDERDAGLDCYLDDQIKIFRKNTIELRVGKSLCRYDGAPVKDRLGGWQMTDGLNLFLRVNPEQPYELKILALNANQMEVSYISNNGKRVRETYIAIDLGENEAPTPAPLGSNIGQPPALSPP